MSHHKGAARRVRTGDQRLPVYDAIANLDNLFRAFARAALLQQFGANLEPGFGGIESCRVGPRTEELFCYRRLGRTPTKTFGFRVRFWGGRDIELRMVG